MREPERHAGSLDVLTMLAIRCDDKKKSLRGILTVAAVICETVRGQCGLSLR